MTATRAAAWRPRTAPGSRPTPRGAARFRGVVAWLRLVPALGGSALATLWGADELRVADILRDPATNETLVTHYHSGHRLFLLQAEVGWTRPLRLVVDTGASVLVLDRAAARRLAAAGLWRKDGRVGIETASGADTTLDRGRLERLKFGQTEMAEVLGLTAELDALGGMLQMPLDGLAGYALFQRGVLTFDYPRELLHFGPPPATPQTNGYALTAYGANPRLRLNVAGRAVEYSVDTGAVQGWEVPNQSWPTAKAPRQVGTWTDLVGTHPDYAARLEGDVELGNLRFVRPVVSLVEQRPKLATGVLRHFAVSLNQRDGRIVFLAPKPATVTTPPLRRLGFTWTPDVGGLRVQALLPDTAAGRAGVQPKDLVVRLAGRLTAGMGPGTVREIEDASEAVDLEVRRGDRELTIKLPITTLIE